MTVSSGRRERLQEQLLKAFSFHLNEQTTSKALWNMLHTLQQSARNRVFTRPIAAQSSTFCMVSVASAGGQIQWTTELGTSVRAPFPFSTGKLPFGSLRTVWTLIRVYFGGNFDLIYV